MAGFSWYDTMCLVASDWVKVVESNELLPLAIAIHRSRERAASPANVCMYSFTYDIFSDVDGFSNSNFWIPDPSQS